ncbi:SdpI family protein [Nocardia sp. X0981]
MTNPSAIRLALLAGLPPVLSAVPNIVLLAAAADRLPDPLATHFGAYGADGFTGRVTIMVVSAALGIGVAVLFAAILVAGVRSGKPPRTPDSPFDQIRFLVATAWGVGGFLGTLTLGATIANLDAVDVTRVTLPVSAFVAAVAIGILFAAAGWLIAPDTPVAEAARSSARPLALGPTERVSWSRRVSSPWMLSAGVVTLLLGVGSGFVLHPLMGVLLALTGVLLAHLSSIRVVVDQRGLTVGTGPFGRPMWRLRPEDITEVFAENISPIHYGGYGIRVIPGATAVLLRGGPGIVVTRRSGRRFAVAVGDAETGASVLAGIAERAA